MDVGIRRIGIKSILRIFLDMPAGKSFSFSLLYL